MNTSVKDNLVDSGSTCELASNSVSVDAPAADITHTRSRPGRTFGRGTALFHLLLVTGLTLAVPCTAQAEERGAMPEDLSEARLGMTEKDFRAHMKNVLECRADSSEVTCLCQFERRKQHCYVARVKEMAGQDYEVGYVFWADELGPLRLHLIDVKHSADFEQKVSASFCAEKFDEIARSVTATYGKFDVPPRVTLDVHRDSTGFEWRKVKAGKRCGDWGIKLSESYVTWPTYDPHKPTPTCANHLYYWWHTPGFDAELNKGALAAGGR